MYQDHSKTCCGFWRNRYSRGISDMFWHLEKKLWFVNRNGLTTSRAGNVSQSARVILIRFISGDVIQRPASRAGPSLLAICPYLSNIVVIFPTRCSDNFRYSFPRLFGTQLMRIVTSAISFQETCNGNKRPILLVCTYDLGQLGRLRTLVYVTPARINRCVADTRTTICW